MKYAFNEDYDISLEDRIFQINNTNIEEINLTNFNNTYNIDVLNKFKEKLLLNKDKKFFIVGDYDCDGICATAIITRMFEKLGIYSKYYIPSRSKSGYGINNEIVKNAYDNNFECIFCVDNGIIAYEQIEYAYSIGLKVFIIDHHEYETAPNCESFLHSNILPQEFNDACASGICALLANSFDEDDYITTLGGIATLADMVSIFSYNRYIVKSMFENLKKHRYKQILLLLGSNEISYQNIQYNVIPKINAVSRLDDILNVNYVVKYLLSNNDECIDYYEKIQIINNVRKELSKKMYENAINSINVDDDIIVIKNNEFKEGLCGLLANRIMNEYGKPTLVFTEIDGEVKGSGRSSNSFNLYSFLKQKEKIYKTFGGHENAVGLSMDISNFDMFLEYINNSKVKVEEEIKDVIMINIDDINSNMIESIESLKPFGTGFNEPLFAIKKTKYNRIYIVSNKYPKFDINDLLSAISFNTKHINKDFDYMIGKIQKDTYYKEKISFVIEDLI